MNTNMLFAHYCITLLKIWKQRLGKFRFQPGMNEYQEILSKLRRTWLEFINEFIKLTVVTLQPRRLFSARSYAKFVSQTHHSNGVFHVPIWTLYIVFMDTHLFPRSSSAWSRSILRWWTVPSLMHRLFQQIHVDYKIFISFTFELHVQ
jgi:hypothetical protein